MEKCICGINEKTGIPNHAALCEKDACNHGLLCHDSRPCTYKTNEFDKHHCSFLYIKGNGNIDG